MTILENILYGLVSGVTEFLPVSSKAHQSLLRYILGTGDRIAIQDLFIHIGILFSVLIAARESIIHLYREQQAISIRRRRKNHAPNHITYYNLRLLKTASFPLFIGSLLYIVTKKFENNLLAMMFFVIINGIIILIAEHTRRGNRDARTMSGLDGIVMGILGTTASLPGISRTGMISSYATMRGADGRSVVQWAILLCIPALLFSICYDVFCVIVGGVATPDFLFMLGCFLSGCAAFCGGYFGISMLKLVLLNSGFTKFSYYCFGIAMLIFILYLLT